MTFDVYLSYLSDRSHFMVPLRAVTSVRLQRIVLDPIKITSSYCMGVPESSALSTEVAGDVALICSIAIVTLCVVSDSDPLLK